MTDNGIGRLLESRGLPTRHVRGWVNTNCPFCRNPRDEHCNGGFSLGIPAYNCWRCGKHNWAEALSLVLHVSPAEARRMVSALPGGVGVARRRATGRQLELPGHEAFTAAERRYLEERGFSPERLSRKFSVRGGGIAGEWSYRIIVPVFSGGELVSWTGRSILPREEIGRLGIPRYKNLSVEASAVNPKELLFNMDNAPGSSVLVAEGPFDVMRLGDGAVCSLGTSVTPAQKELLAARWSHVILAFDSEPAAQEKARRLGRDLSMLGLDVEVADICRDFGKDDPGELSPAEAEAVMAELGLRGGNQ